MSCLSGLLGHANGDTLLLDICADCTNQLTSLCTILPALLCLEPGQFFMSPGSLYAPLYNTHLLPMPTPTEHISEVCESKNVGI